MTKQQINQIAKIAHGACAINSGPASKENGSHWPWDQQPEASRENMRKIVYGMIEDISTRDVSVSFLAHSAHVKFLNSREAQGWVYGKKKDTANKISPNMLEFERLSNCVKMNYFILAGIVKGMHERFAGIKKGFS